MNKDKCHLQLRISKDLRNEIGEISRKFGMSAADVIRGTLLLGLPVFATLNDLNQELTRRMVSILKSDTSRRGPK